MAFHRYNAVYSCIQFLQFLACRVFQDTWAAQTINGDCLAETPPQMKCALHAAFVQIRFFKSCKGKWSCTGGLCWWAQSGTSLEFTEWESTYISIFQKKSRDIGRSTCMDGLGYWHHVWKRGGVSACYSESASDSGREQPATKTGYATRTQERPGARSVSLIRSTFVVWQLRLLFTVHPCSSTVQIPASRFS